MDFQKRPCFQRKIGATGFEPATSASRTLRSTKLSHAPKILNSYLYDFVSNAALCQTNVHIVIIHFPNVLNYNNINFYVCPVLISIFPHFFMNCYISFPYLTVWEKVCYRILYTIRILYH